jgi:zeaxanthin glucosyltransferase
MLGPMASIAIVPLPEPGHINPTTCFSRQLTELGHQVTYVATEEHAELFRARSLSVRFGRPRSHMDISQIGFDIDFKPDVALVDSTIPYISLWAWEQGWPVVHLSILFPRRYDPLVPPLGSHLLPSSEEQGRARIQAAWNAEHEANVNRRSRHVGARAQAAGLGPEWVDERAALGAFLRFPELVLGAEELDFTRSQKDDLFYAGPTVDLSRAEPPYPFERLPEGRRMIYCSFGSQLHRYARLEERFQLLIQAARQLADVHFVIAAGSEYSGEVPPNVSVVPHAPQLAMLRRATLMVSHGGINSIHEALCMGVPLLVLPFDLDQPGNAARVEYRGFGRRLPWEQASPASVCEALRSLLDDEATARRVRALSHVLRAAMEEGRAAKAFAQCWARYQDTASIFFAAREADASKAT